MRWILTCTAAVFLLAVTPASAQAYEATRHAAEQADADAQVTLGVMYASGRGVPQDYVSAHMWLNLAAATAAGLERRVTAHSGRVGLASELTSRGASTTDVMLAGNWKTSRMVAHYAAGATAERGAVARYL